ncbi:type II toxin-antitoxin system RelE/ParE family toxin [Candidatus Acetothermia bacterium]|jgi:mRNA-degrading endonuclease RelE of RelBE toxin-antitoxin system|nr:type II toxin-antitoxin system RelE/ParE family toxin [Candidatus Acetothermia bacterium]MCI2431339.1 type II toxin-antitoxin system RelE/ParE family toxin [Candidatus Acetothermia bacterium]MCI2436993.1 type II toxin-antitoxin system RelE/ParE family toxin [Candidatus Acetothermia bacterium]
MELERTQSFERDYKKLSHEIKRRVEQALRFLTSNPRHPSLEARIVDKKHRIWKAKVDGSYRFTFQIEQGLIILRRIGAHDVMERPRRW